MGASSYKWAQVARSYGVAKEVEEGQSPSLSHERAREPSSYSR